MSASQSIEKNDISDVTNYIPEGRERAPFYRYFRFNLPRLTRALLICDIAGISAMAATVALSDFSVFAQSPLVLWLLCGLGVVFAICALIPSVRPWDFGLVPALSAVIIWITSWFTHALTPHNGADLFLSAGWNLMFFLALGYIALYWALHVRMIVAYPDDQGFDD